MPKENKRLGRWLLVGLALLIGLGVWRFSSVDNLPSPAPATIGSEANRPPALPPVAPAQKFMETASIEAPKQTPVQASESPPPPNNNNLGDDFGKIEFFDNVPVVRTLASGDTCVIVPTVINDPRGNQISLHMLVEKAGSNMRSPAEIEALRGAEAKSFINSELSAARTDTTKIIMALPLITVMVGVEVKIATGQPGPDHIGIRLTPLLAGEAGAESEDKPAGK